MKIKTLEIHDLPKLDNIIKNSINNGLWLLFKTEPEDFFDALASYYLKVDDVIYSIDDEGNILNVFSNNSNLLIKELFYFSNIERPMSLSNVCIVNSISA